MDDKTDLPDVPQAEQVMKKRMRFSVVWIIPLVAAVVAFGIAVQQYLSQGPTITIVFKAAEGVVAGKTFVKYKDVEIGRVKTVKLSDDYSRIVVTARMDKHVEGLIVEDAKFWVVQPQVSLSGVSGIGTLLSGNYIGFGPGKSKNRQDRFIGVEVPPIIKGDQPGREFVLRAEDLGSLGIGTPVYYRRLNVGQVIAYDLAGDGKSFNIKVFVNAPHDKYVTGDTRFWQASGIDVALGANGVSVKTQSLLSVLIGGIAFDGPPRVTVGEAAAENAVFKLYDDRAAAFAPVETEGVPFVLFFKESLRGLTVGAPVTFLGLTVGEVTDVGLEYNPKTTGIRSRVKIAIYPPRFVANLPKEGSGWVRPKTEESRQAFMQRMVDGGVRAQLNTGSFISGQLYVSLEYFPNAPKVKIDWTKEPPELPVVAGGLTDMQAKVLNILEKIEKVPLDDISRDLKKVLESLDQALKDGSRMLNNVDGEFVPEVKKTLQKLDRAIDDAGRILERMDAELVPEVKKTLESLRQSVAAAERVMDNANTALLGPDAPAQQELRDALQEIARAARGIRVLSDYLERNPDALIRGKNQEKP
jgi:paraquat-inducible protein B